MSSRILVTYQTTGFDLVEVTTGESLRQYIDLRRVVKKPPTTEIYNRVN